MGFNYITKKDKTKDLYYKIPKQLMLENKYKKMKDSSKILYSILYERTNLSISKNWFDSKNRAYIICTYDEIQVLFRCSRDKVSKCIKELERYHLLKRDKIKAKDGNLVNVLYIAYVDTSSETLDQLLDNHKSNYHKLRDKNREYKRDYDKQKNNFLKSKKQTTIGITNFKKYKLVKPSNFNGSLKIRLQEVQKTDYSNTDFNKTNIISMYVCNENLKNKNFIDRYKNFLYPSSYAEKVLPILESKIQFDLFDKVLVDALNNIKIKNKENYIIAKLNKLVHSDILTLDKYLQEVSVYNYKHFESKKIQNPILKLSDDEIRERYLLDQCISNELLEKIY
ncbi:MAG: replication initiator protein A [Bacilli bacterium]|uniref:replication initiator protein A n=1 Tax=Terrisporobacter sp. TaxID=1965305 RepID=UPI002FCC6E42